MTDQNLSSKLEESIQYAKATEHIIKNDLESLLRENLKYSEAIFSDIKKIKKPSFASTSAKATADKKASEGKPASAKATADKEKKTRKSKKKKEVPEKDKDIVEKDTVEIAE